MKVIPLDKVRKLVNCGFTLSDIAPKMDISITGLRKKIIRHCSDLLPQIDKNRRAVLGNSRRWYDRNAILLLSSKGLGFYRIADKLGYDESAVYKTVKALLSPEEYEYRHSRSKRGKYGPRYFRNSRGDILASLPEQRIANFLYLKKIKYKTQCRIQLNGNYYHPDFCLDFGCIEYFGMTGREFYDEKTRRKLRDFRKEGIPLLALYPFDFKENIWRVKIEIFNYVHNHPDL